MRAYETVTEAINNLKKRGYTHDFTLHANCLEGSALQLKLHPENFTIDEYYRFEGMTNPDDNCVVYALSSKDGDKGILVDAYGTYAEQLTPEMAQKLAVKW
ncbi:MAG: hypothetical protein KatS3mg031_0280 [Chitinophagales bacterium]|nr:MAG: hypothetical protein KatS3mg031_0280 [Chitinophagales bacterium]